MKSLATSGYYPRCLPAGVIGFFVDGRPCMFSSTGPSPGLENLNMEYDYCLTYLSIRSSSQQLGSILRASYRLLVHAGWSEFSCMKCRIVGAFYGVSRINFGLVSIIIRALGFMSLKQRLIL